MRFTVDGLLSFAELVRVAYSGGTVVKPEVLVWALLFVIAVGLAYRFFDRTFRRMKRTGEDPAALLKPSARAEAERTAPTIEARKPARFSAAPVTTTPPPARPVQVVVPPQADEAPPAVLPRLVPAAEAAVATRGRTVIAAPDVRATLPPTFEVPDVRATLPPTFAAPDVRATLPPTSATMVADTAPSLQPATRAPDAASAIPATIRRRGTMLRARRIGLETPPLDQRIKESRSRKLRRRSKARRKLRTLPKKPRKAPPPRRIGADPKGSDAFASAKAMTRIIGMPHQALRVRRAAGR